MDVLDRVLADFRGANTGLATNQNHAVIALAHKKSLRLCGVRAEHDVKDAFIEFMPLDSGHTGRAKWWFQVVSSRADQLPDPLFRLTARAFQTSSVSFAGRSERLNHARSVTVLRRFSRIRLTADGQMRSAYFNGNPACASCSQRRQRAGLSCS